MGRALPGWATLGKQNDLSELVFTCNMKAVFNDAEPSVSKWKWTVNPGA